MCIAMIQEPKGKCYINDSNTVLQQGKNDSTFKKRGWSRWDSKKAFTVFFAFGRVSTRYAGSNQKNQRIKCVYLISTTIWERERVQIHLSLCVSIVRFISIGAIYIFKWHTNGAAVKFKLIFKILRLDAPCIPSTFCRQLQNACNRWWFEYAK